VETNENEWDKGDVTWDVTASHSNHGGEMACTHPSPGKQDYHQNQHIATRARGFIQSTKHKLDRCQEPCPDSPNPEDASNMVTEFERWAMGLPMKASHAQLNTKTHQVVVQHTYIQNDKDKTMSPAEIERELLYVLCISSRAGPQEPKSTQVGL